MNAYLLSMAAVTATVFTLLWWRDRRAFDSGAHDPRAAAHALLGCRQLLAMIKAMQRHRGMSSALLAGDRSFESSLLRLRIDLGRLLQEASQMAREESDMPWPCFTHNELSLLRHQWEKLVDELSKLSVEQSIARHSQLVGQVLDWLAALGEARLGLAFSSSLPAGLAANYAHRLPALAECLGQARALGSSAAASGSCTPVARVRLMFLLNRAEGLARLIVDASLDGTVGQGGSAARAVADVRTLLALIRNEILEPSRITLPATAYFEQASRTIDGLFGLIDTCATELERNLGVTSSRLAV